MKPAGPHWFWLVVLSGAGVLGLAAWGLWSSSKNADAQLRNEALELTRSRATLLRAEVLSASTLDRLPENQRFSVRESKLQVPDALAWFPEPPARPEPQLGSASSRAEVARARSLEWGPEGGAAKVLAHWRRVLAELDASDPGYIVALLAALLCAERLQNSELIERCESGLSARRADLTRDQFQAWVAYLLRCGAAEAERGLRLMDDVSAAALLDAHDEEAESQLRGGLAQRQAWRRRLQQVEDLRAGWSRAQAPAVWRAGSELLIYIPEAGEGALVDPDRLSSVISSERLGAARLVDDSTPGAFAVVPGLALLPPKSVDDGVMAWGLGLLLIALGVILLASLVALRRAALREAEASAAKAEFLTSMTHELKTPLASIRLLAEMLEEGRYANEEKRDSYQRQISSEAARLSMHIENVLDLGRLERGERGFDLREQGLLALVEEAVELFRPIADRDGLTLELTLPSQELTLLVDRSALVQVLLNLMDNARKYAASGQRIVIVADAERVTLRDFGPGVPEAERERIFARFRRGLAQADGVTPGVGLGLHLARTLMRAQGGDIELMPAPEGGGAMFAIKLPLASSEQMA